MSHFYLAGFFLFISVAPAILNSCFIAFVLTINTKMFADEAGGSVGGQNKIRIFLPMKYNFGYL